ncbi:MAG: Transcription initiation factor TFIID subunit 9 [Watsoniomyces obsoletus]|nr:MAG: Transcription initiation factor TFIID subunit 9 [Watsoniomyces obsoletus]
MVAFWMTSLYLSSRALKRLAVMVMPGDQTISIFNGILTCAAVTWLLYRAWLVLRIPLPQLVDLLGLDVPPAPVVSLAGIDANSITLHWTRSEGDTPILKYVILVNGIAVGESRRSETAITVSGLHPDRYYGIRVIAVNANYQRTSEVIRIKTLAKDGRQEISTALGTMLHSGSRPGRGPGSGGEHRGEGLGGRAYCHEAEPTAPATGATTSGRDRQAGNNATKRSAIGRRGSPLTGAPESTSSVPGPPVASEIPISRAIAESSVEQLAERLDVIRRETEELQLVKAKEEEDFRETKESLVRERDRLKQLLKEKDEASAELRKEVQSLERQNRVVQSNKSAKERLLRQKQEERQKMEQDVERWKRETEAYVKEMEKMKTRKQRVSENASTELKSMRDNIHENQTAIKEMEEDIRIKGAQIKEFEDERRVQAEEDDRETQERERRAQEEDEKQELKLQELQTTYTKMLRSVQQARDNHHRASERLAWWRAHGIPRPVQFAPSASTELESLSMNAPPQQRRTRSTRTRPVNKSSPVNGYPGEYQPRPPSTMMSFFNTPSAGAVPSAPNQAGMSPEDVEQLTAGAHLSPRADLLLPSNLLSGSDEDIPNPRWGSISASLSTTRPTDLNSFPTSSAPFHESLLHDTHSPDSPGSREASLISSPHGSLLNLPGNHLGADSPLGGGNLSHSSLDAIYTDHPSPGPRRFANLFSLNRQRGKTMEAEAPALGDLKSAQTQSFPKNWDQPSGRLDPIGTKRRRGSYSTSWIGSMAGFNSRHRSSGLPARTSEEIEENVTTGTSPRRKPFAMFGSGSGSGSDSKTDRLNLPDLLRESTPERPISRSSGDHMLPRPSSESQRFGWGVSREPHQSGMYWSQKTMDPWSRGPSRQSSGQKASGPFGSSSSLSLGLSPLDADPVETSTSPPSVPQAPIGTRPRSSPKVTIETPKLNPAAPSFKTLFNNRKEARRSEKADKQERAAELEREKEKERERDRDFESLQDDAVHHRRSSRDTRSLHTEESMAESTESVDRPNSAAASDSGITPSGSLPKDRESIFQKISRKSSATKFNVPWKDKNARVARRAADPSTASSQGDADEDVSTEASFGRSVDSIAAGSSPRLSSSAGGKGSLSWSSLRRKSRKGDKSVGEAVERGVSSERGDDEDAVPPLI